MKERPILFNAEMVRAILDGRKTQTRRPVKPQPPADIDSLHHGKLASLAPYKLLDDDYNPQGFGFEDGRGQFWKSPFGTVGDRLWVREAFGFSRQCDDVNEQERVVVYKACEPFHVTDAGVDLLKLCNSGCLMQPNHYVGTPRRWTPSIHMPRWASRIDLEITRVWVERVQDITEEDAQREGCEDSFEHSEDCDDENCTLSGCPDDCVGFAVTAKTQFRDLWQSIYGTWDANPWVWAYEFRRIKP